MLVAEVPQRKPLSQPAPKAKVCCVPQQRPRHRSFLCRERSTRGTEESLRPNVSASSTSEVKRRRPRPGNRHEDLREGEELGVADALDAFEVPRPTEHVSTAHLYASAALLSEAAPHMRVADEQLQVLIDLRASAFTAAVPIGVGGLPMRRAASRNDWVLRGLRDAFILEPERHLDAGKHLTQVYKSYTLGLVPFQV